MKDEWTEPPSGKELLLPPPLAVALPLLLETECGVTNEEEDEETLDEDDGEEDDE